MISSQYFILREKLHDLKDILEIMFDDSLYKELNLLYLFGSQKEIEKFEEKIKELEVAVYENLV